MNYKKIIKSARLRQNILKALSFIPDKTMLKLQYRIKLKRGLNLVNPQRYTEKLQLYKLYYRNPEMGRMVDKFEVRNYVKERGIEINFPELYGVYDKAEKIDFSKLPARFVIKTTDGSGGNNIVICKDKSRLDIEKTVREVNSWLDKKSANPGREWAYTQMPDSLIIVEEFLENKENPEGGLEDFKFFCFDGKPFAVVHDGDRYIGHKRNIYDLEWNDLKIGSDCANFEHPAPKPSTLEEMIKFAGKLSEGLPSVRVDLYSVEGKVYFGEMTFYPWSGYVQFTPDSFDFELGKLFDVSSFIPQNKG